MELAIVAVLALSLGFVLGMGAGTVRALRHQARVRAAQGASAVLAQVWGDGPPKRDPRDIWAGRIVITLGGLEYVLPIAPKRVAAGWIARLDERFAHAAALIEASDVPDALRVLASHTDTLHDMLIDYAATVGVELPARDSELDLATAPEILRATVEVWAALHPLAVALATSESPTSGGSAASTTSSAASTDGVATTSTTSSPTSSSLPTSTPPPSASKTRAASSGTAGSKLSGSARSSRATGSSTAAGAPARGRARSSAASPAPHSSRP